MLSTWPRAWGEPVGRAVIRARPEDFRVSERLGFEASTQGEHVFLHVEKRELTTFELQDRLARFTGVDTRNIGFSGMKDRNAVTRQWVSIGMAGKPEPNWAEVEDPGYLRVLAVSRHNRKLKRGVHASNHFELRLASLQGEQRSLEARLQRVASDGVPNYYGPQRFGRGGQTLAQARSWVNSGRRKISRRKRSLYLSALRAYLFNELLAARVRSGTWNRVVDGDVCVLGGTRSRFSCARSDAEITRRCQAADLHPGLPLWGLGPPETTEELHAGQLATLAEYATLCDFLIAAGVALDYRPARLMADDFCWQFCDDGSLHMQFALGPGGYATAVLTELVEYTEGMAQSGTGSE